MRTDEPLVAHGRTLAPIGTRVEDGRELSGLVLRLVADVC